MGLKYPPDNTENEALLRKEAKFVRDQIKDGNVETALKKLNERPDILFYDFGRNIYKTLIPIVKGFKIENKYDILEKLNAVGVEICQKNNFNEPLMFYAAATCNLKLLKETILLVTKDDPELINTTREGYSLLLYLVKFGNFKNPNFNEVFSYIINHTNINVNESDYSDIVPLDYLINKYTNTNDKHMRKSITESIIILIRHKTTNLCDIKNQNQLKEILLENDIKLDATKSMDTKNKSLFSMLIKKEQTEFIKSIKELKIEIDIDDGSNTLLQLCCKNNLELATECILSLGADVNKTTKSNNITPITIAATRKFTNIFRLLLTEYEKRKIKIDQSIFNHFVQLRGGQIKPKFVDALLESDSIDPHIVYTNGNTPLHYAIFFENKKAIINLLNKGASLTKPNESGKTPLHYISREDLKIYLDTCIIPDKFNRIHNRKFEMRFNFNLFLQESNNEVSALEQICSEKSLRSLFKHPTVLSFINLKYRLISDFLEKIIQVCFLSFICMLLSNVSHFSESRNISIFDYIFCIFCSVVFYMYFNSDKILTNHYSYLLLIISCLLYGSHKIIMPLLSYVLVLPVKMIYCKETNLSPSKTHLLFIGISFVISFYQYYYILQYIYTFILFLNLCSMLVHYPAYHKVESILVNQFSSIFTSFSSNIFITLLIILFIGLYKTFDVDKFKTLSLEVILFIFLIFFTLYNLILTIFFSALTESSGDVNKTINFYRYQHIIKYIKFAENFYNSSSSKDQLINPFLSAKLSNSDVRRRHKINFLLNKNKFVDEKLQFIKLDQAVVEEILEKCEKLTRIEKYGKDVIQSLVEFIVGNK